MKLTLRHIHHQPSPAFAALIARQLEALQNRLVIDEARVVIERRSEASPAFHISAHLVTPGPDVFAEADDHTLHAALKKTVEQLEGKIGQRIGKRARRLRGQLSEPAILRSAPVRTGLV